MLGQGVYGKVTKKGRYAYKTSKVDDISEDIGGWVACAREIHCLGLNHTNLCKRYSFMCASMQFQLKMEVGVPLQVKQANPFKLLTHIGSALQYMHAHGILHRDVKPDNIILVGNVYKLIDFGLARPNCKGSDCLTGYTITRYWRPPELLEAKHYRIYTGKCDMWSLGVVYYQCVHKKLPFIGDADQMLDTIAGFEPVGILQHLLVPVKERFTSTQLMRWMNRVPHRRRVRVCGSMVKCKVPKLVPAVRQVMDQYLFRKRRHMMTVMLLSCLVCGYEDDAIELVKTICERYKITTERVFRWLGKVKRIQ